MEKKLQLFKTELNHELISILNYWIDNTVDHKFGGFYGKIDHFNGVIPKAPKGAVLNSRILWTFSAAFNHFKKEKYLDIATQAFEYSKGHFYDEKNGGLIWEVDYLGKPLNTRKQIYAQGFGIYGFSEYYKATGNQESLDLATSLFDKIETHSYDIEYGGYIEALDKEWNHLYDMRLSDKDANFPKSMNTHLHVLEPYTNLYRVWENEMLAEKIQALIRVFLDHIIDTDTFHFNLFFEHDWEVKSRIVSYGHDIEGTWLLTEAAEIIGDIGLLREVQEIALKMTEATLHEGTDGDGAIFYEKNIETNHLDTDKHWWPQAEAVIGFINAYQISGDQKYLQKSMDVWQFINDNLFDPIHGEWFWSVNMDGVPNEKEDKAGFWKCPYHNTRACIEGIERLLLINQKT